MTAVRNVSLSAGANQVVVLIGANGAGKTSTFRAIFGLVPREGQLYWDGRDISRLPCHKMARLGVTLVPEGRRVFAPLSVDDNLALGAYTVAKRARREGIKGKVYELFPRLAERRRTSAGLLSGGEQQMLAIGRALMSDPRMIVMDEPSLGLSPVLVDTVMSTISQIASDGVGILMAEQNAHAALRIADFAVVLERGVTVFQDKASNLANNPALVRAYLGEAAEIDQIDSGAGSELGSRSTSESGHLCRTSWTLQPLLEFIVSLPSG